MAGSLGYCALDRRRDPLVGDEIRSCWEAAETAALVRSGPGAPWTPAGFIEMDDALPPTATASGSSEPGWSLWGDPEA